MWWDTEYLLLQAQDGLIEVQNYVNDVLLNLVRTIARIGKPILLK